MTRLLAIECSTDACSVALGFGQDIQERWVIQPREHQRILLPMITELLEANQTNLEDIDAIAYGAGPGSFTGLRLCVGVTQGLAFALQKPVIPVSSLAATALSFAQKHSVSNQVLLVALDARMGDVYLGTYCRSGDVVTALAEDRLLSRTALQEVADAYPQALQIGSGWLTPQDCHPRAGAVLALASAPFQNKQMLMPAEAVPVYLRETVSWQKWQPKSSRNPV